MNGNHKKGPPDVYVPLKRAGTKKVNWIKSKNKSTSKNSSDLPVLKKTTSLTVLVPLQPVKSKTTLDKEAAKKKSDKLRREVRKCLEETEKGLQEAESVNNAVETVNNNYRDSKNFIKSKLSSTSQEYSGALELEKAQLTGLAERIRVSEEERQQMQLELERALKFIEEYDDIASKSWFARFIRWIY